MEHEHHSIGKVIDPVCGMTIAPEDAVGHTEHDGTTYHFCNPSCMEKFQPNPQRCLKSQGPAVPPGGSDAVEHTCPMHPEVRQTGSGTCPKCGMALEPATIALPQTRTEYTCPMHPEIVRSEPGSCPICGMALEPREVTGEEANSELADMTRRFWTSVALTIPILAFMISFSSASYWNCTPEAGHPVPSRPAGARAEECARAAPEKNLFASLFGHCLNCRRGRYAPLSGHFAFYE